MSLREQVVELDEPSLLAHGLLALASSVASWLTARNQHTSMHVLSADAGLAAALGEGLRLLGLAAPERM